MAKQRTDIMQDDSVVMIYLIVFCAVLMLLGMSMA
jgi:hypothetical protein